MFPAHGTIPAHRSTLSSDKRAGHNLERYLTLFHVLSASISAVGILTFGRQRNVFRPSLPQICFKRLENFRKHYTAVFPSNRVVYPVT